MKKHIINPVIERYKKANIFFYGFAIEKSLTLLILYIILIIVGASINQSIKFHCKYENWLFGTNFELSFWFYQAIIVIITFLAYFSIKKFNSFRPKIEEEAQKVNKNSKIAIYVKYIEEYFVILIILGSIAITSLFINNTRLKLSDYPKVLSYYVAVLVFCAAFTVIMSYAMLIALIFIMREVYNLEFDTYTTYYPISTKIFQEYNKVIAYGLVRFWIISIIVISLVLFVVKFSDAYALVSGVFLLIFLGFIIFTLYPYYYTSKKVSELKVRTIGTIVDSKDFNTDNNLHSNEVIIKIVQESPSQVSTNFYMLVWSSTTAILGIVLPLLSQLFFNKAG